ncbi:MAG TPA: diacylglycerol kinase family protein [Myxococcota bacterium]|nr:diacylglycerol kinase family protein [Myxococcota bacterium]
MVRALTKSFLYAFTGLGQALVTERNFRLQWLMGLLASLVIYWGRFERWAEMLLLTIIFIVLSLELQNSAIEKTCDSIGLNHEPLKKKAKDFAAASVLLMSILSLLVFFAIAYDMREPLLLKFVKNILLPIFWLLIFMGNVPLCLIKKLSPYALLISVPNLVLHALFVLVAEGSALFLVISFIFHFSLILACFIRSTRPLQQQ